MNKRQKIIQKINDIKPGVAFDIDDLMDAKFKRGDISYVLCILKKNGDIRTISNGIYYKPQKSTLGMNDLPISRKEIIAYFESKFDCHISGQYGFNLIGLTEQCPYTITLAGPRRFKKFNVDNCYFEYSTSPIGNINNTEELRLAIFLDALMNINGITGRSANDILKASDNLLDTLNNNIELLISLANKYPARVKYILGTLLEIKKKQNALKSNLSNRSLYDKKYKNIFSSRTA